MNKIRNNIKLIAIMLFTATFFSFVGFNIRPDAELTKIDTKVYYDTLVFGDNVSFLCTRCGKPNEHGVYVKLRVPKCR